MVAGGVGARAELADQHDLVAARIVGQDGGGMAAFEGLALEHGGLAALVQAVAEGSGRR